MCDPERETLSDALRRIGLTGVKVGCGTGVCGSCSVISERPGDPFLYEEDRRRGGVRQDHHHRGHRYSPASAPVCRWRGCICGAVQCGFCVPGFIVSAYALLQENPDPDP